MPLILALIVMPVGWTYPVWSLALLTYLVFVMLVCFRVAKKKLPYPMLIVAFFSTLVSSYFNPIDFFQLFRALVPLTLFLVVPWMVGSWGLTKEVKDAIANTIVLFMIINLLFAVSDIPLASYLLSRSDVGLGRLYLIPHTASYAVLCFFLVNNKYKLASVVTGLLLLSGGRTTIVLLLAILILHRKLRFISVAGLSLLALLLLSLYYYFDPSLIEKFSQISTDKRIWEINQGFVSWSRSLFTILFGNGFGVIISEGYFAFSDDPGERARQFYNSQYDLHNLYAYVLARLGLIGFFIISYLIYRQRALTEHYSVLVAIILITGMSAAGLMTGMDGVYFILVWYALFSKKSALRR